MENLPGEAGPLQNLPEDNLLQVYRYLEPWSLLRLASASQFFLRSYETHSPDLWKRYCLLAYFGADISNKDFVAGKSVGPHGQEVTGEDPSLDFQTLYKSITKERNRVSVENLLPPRQPSSRVVVDDMGWIRYTGASLGGDRAVIATPFFRWTYARSSIEQDASSGQASQQCHIFRRDGEASSKLAVVSAPTGPHVDFPSSTEQSEEKLSALGCETFYVAQLPVVYFEISIRDTPGQPINPFGNEDCIAIGFGSRFFPLRNYQ